jgi:hypothetical protein
MIRNIGDHFDLGLFPMSKAKELGSWAFGGTVLL